MDSWLAYSPALLCWVIPLVGSIATLAVAKAGKRARNYFAVLVSAATAALTVMMLPWLFGNLPIDLQTGWVTVPFPPLSNLAFGVLIDPLSIILANVVSLISLAIMIYSIRYMEGDSGLTRYWFFMNLFIGNMILLVMSDNFIQLLFGWEGVGLCSYALIGYWYQDSKKGWLTYWVGEGKDAYSPSHSGLKSYIMTRFGDVLFIAGVFIMIIAAGSTNFLAIQAGVKSLPPYALYAMIPAALLIFGGAIGKSAQLPLMEWLPDAMTGPSTVSALIHAATMVKAGVYLIARIFPIFYVAAIYEPQVLIFFQVVAWIGAITAFVAATQAVVSKELKKILAYSTVSQIGYMMLAMGVAGTAAEFYIGYTAGITSLMSHAVYKAALFLGAGAVIHAVNSRFVYHMGGLRRKMPLTFLAMLISSLSLMGVPLLFSGFWSKDLVLSSTFLSGQYLLLILGLGTVSITCFYTIRMVALVFYQKPSEHQSEGHQRDPPLSMSLPFLALAAVTVLLGILGYFEKGWLFSLFAGYYDQIMGLAVIAAPEGLNSELFIMGVSLAFLLAGSIPAYLIYIRGTGEHWENRLVGLRTFFANRWYINAAYYAAFVTPVTKFSSWLYSEFEGILQPLIDNGTAKGILTLANRFRKTHTGDLNEGVLALVVGLLILMLIIIILITM